MRSEGGYALVLVLQPPLSESRREKHQCVTSLTLYTVTLELGAYTLNVLSVRCKGAYVLVLPPPLGENRREKPPRGDGRDEPDAGRSCLGGWGLSLNSDLQHYTPQL